MKKILSFIIVALMVVSLLGCAAKEPAKTETAATETKTETKTETATEGGETETAPADDPSDTSEHYEFTIYFDNDTQNLREWGSDLVSAYMQEKFNIDLIMSRADTDPDTKMNLMLNSEDYPEVMYMSGETTRIFRCAELGVYMNLDPLIEVNPLYNEFVDASAKAMLRMEDGNLYTIPHWIRSKPTGGGISYQYTKKIYEAAGSPEIHTLEDAHDYLMAAKALGNTWDGLPIVPFVTGVDKNAGSQSVEPFYRALGGASHPANDEWYGRLPDGTFGLLLRSEKYKAATMMANQWFRDGLIPETQFSDTRDQLVEKLAAGRVALAYWGVDSNESTHYRDLLNGADPDNDFIVLTDPVFLPAGGLSADDLNPDFQDTFHWYGMYITNHAEKPQRIFDLFMFMLSPEGSVNMMYGPEGEVWEGYGEDGYPIIKIPESELTEEDKARIGCWNWAILCQSDHVDGTKFAVDAQLPADQQNWVASKQRDLFTPLLTISNEYCNVMDVVDPTTDVGIAAQLCKDQIEGTLPKIIMASSAEEASAMYDELVKFCDDNGIAGAEELRNAQYQKNLEIQGFSVFK